MHKLPHFEEYINHLNIDLATPGSPSLSLNKLHELCDSECSKLLKAEVKIQDYLGNPILRNQIKKTFFNNKEAPNNIIIRSNIAEIVSLIATKSSVKKLDLPAEIVSTEEIISYIKSKDTNPQELYYYIDKYGLDFNNIKLNTSIVISSLEIIYGIKGLNVAWAYIQSDILYQEICDELSYIGPSASYLSEIYAIIAVRNDLLIKSINQKIIADNLRSLSSFLEKYSNLFEYKIFQLCNYCIINLKDRAREEKLLNNSMLLLRKSSEGILIHYGQRNFISGLLTLERLLTQ